jgi:hypothetical protein
MVTNQVEEMSTKEVMRFQYMLAYLESLSTDCLNTTLSKTVDILNQRAELGSSSQKAVDKYKEDMKARYVAEMQSIRDTFNSKMVSIQEDAKKQLEAEYTEKTKNFWQDVSVSVDLLRTHLMEVDGYTKEELNDWTIAVWKDENGERRIYLNDSNPYKDKDYIQMGVYYINGNQNYPPMYLKRRKHISVPSTLFQRIAEMFDTLGMVRFGDF